VIVTVDGTGHDMTGGALNNAVLQMEQTSLGVEQVIKVGVTGIEVTLPGDGGDDVLSDGHGGFIFYSNGAAGMASGDITLFGGGLSGDVGFFFNTMSDRDVDETIVIDGQEIRVQVDRNTIGFFASNAQLQIGDYFILSGDFAVVNVDRGLPTERTLIGARDVLVFLGRGPPLLEDGVTENPDAIGVKIDHAEVGVVMFPDDTFAFVASGKACFVGLGAGFEITGSLTARVNTSGRTVNETITIPGSGDVIINFPSTARVEYFEGAPHISLGGVLTLDGTIRFTRKPNDTVQVDIPEATVSINYPDRAGDMHSAFSITGDARFSFGGEQGFRLEDLKVDGFSIFGSPMATITNSAPEIRPPTADLSLPYAGGSFVASELNSRHYIEVVFTDLNDSGGVADDTITDGAPEFVLTVDGNPASDYGIILNGAARKVGDATFQYDFSGSFPGNGQVAIQFLATSFADAGGTNNVDGIYVYNPGSATRTFIGSSDLTQGLGNMVYNNSRHGIEANGYITVAGNTVYGHTATNYAGIYLTGNDAIAERNVVYNNWSGISAAGGNGNQVNYNRAYANTSRGIYITTYGATVTGNVVYANPYGIAVSVYDSYAVQVRNNLVYANPTTGIYISDGYNHQVINNTVYQPQGDAIILTASVRDMQLRNNIVWVENGRGISVSSDSQTGFTGDYNLFHTPGAGIVGSWQDVDRVTLSQWRNASFTDTFSISGDPLFVDPDGTDNILGFSTTPDGIPLIIDDGDAGFSTSGTGSWFSRSGGYGDDNLGSNGSTTAAWAFSGLAPGWYRVATTWVPGGNEYDTSARYRVNAGATAFDVTVYKDHRTGVPDDFTYAGTAWEELAVIYVGTDSLNVYLSDDLQGRVCADAVLIQSVAGDCGSDDDFHLQSLYESFHGSALAPVIDQAPGLTQGLPVFLSGAWVSDPVDPPDDLVDRSPAIDRGLGTPVNEPASDGGYINIGAYGDTDQASKSPAEYVLVIRPNGGEGIPQDSTFTILWRSFGFAGNVNIEYSADDGATYAAVSLDEPHDGSYAWYVDEAVFPVSDLYRIRISAEEDPSIADVSDAPFRVSVPIFEYYVDDSSNDNDQYTPNAIGDDANDGLSPLTPKASIRAILETYDLDAGDIIYVDTGVYVLTTNITIGNEDSGVEIHGPDGAGRAAVLNRANAASSSYVFYLNNADDITFSHLAITGAYYGIVAGSGSDSDNLTVESCDIYGNSQHGVYLETSNDDATIVDSLVHNNGSHGLYLRGARSEISGGEVYRNGYYGVYVYYGESSLIHGVHVYANSQNGIYVINNAAWSEVYDNVVHDNGNHGIYANQNVLVHDNIVYGHTNGSYSGIYVDNGARAAGNDVYGNWSGITATSSEVRDNRVYANTSRGIYVNPYNSTVIGNRVFDNPYGIYVGLYDGSTATIENNVIYDSSLWAVVFADGYNHSFRNNTIYQPAGSGQGISLTSSVRNMNIRSNILWVEQGRAIEVATDSQSGFNSDYNVFYLSGTAVVGYWEGLNFADLVDWYYELGNDQHSVQADAADAVLLLENPAGADAILGYDWAFAGPALIVDDGDPEFSTTGTWTVQSDRGYNGDQRINDAGTGADTATWTFEGLTAGWYQVSATWVSANYYTYAYNAPYTIYDAGVATALSTKAQRYTSDGPNDFTDAGATWEVVDIVQIRDDDPDALHTLVVVLSDAASGPVTADAIHVRRIEGDHGADDDFHLTAQSIAIDRGDPLSYYLSEPAPNGNRVNAGAYGNTLEAQVSPSVQLVQVLTPNGLEKYEVGQPVNIQWHSSGLGVTDTVLLMNVGESTVSGGALGTWLTHAYSTTSYYTNSLSTSYTIDTSAVTDPAPESVYRQFAYSQSSSLGSSLAYHLPVPDGDYVIRLHFLEDQYYAVVGTRLTDIYLQGVLVADNFDIYAEAGARYVAVAKQFTVNASGGTGIDLNLVVAKSGYAALISGIELSRVGAGVADPAVDIAVSPNNGTSWIPVATGVGMNRFGEGSYLWSAGPEVDTNQALIRVTATTGAMPQDTSDRPFLIANNGSDYYVNLSLDAGDEYTTAAGDNAASGKSPDAPMASLAAVLRAYDLDAGDIIYVDTGTYVLAINTYLYSEDSGVEIRGPVGEGHTAIINRNNTNSDAYVFLLLNADDITFSHLAITGAYYGIVAGSGSDSDNLTVESCDIYGNSQYGVYLETSNDDATIVDSLVHNNGSHGLYLRGARSEVSGGEVYRNGYYGVYVYYAEAPLIHGTHVYANSSYGIYIINNSTWGEVYDNVVHDNGNHGIYVSQNVLVRNNTVYSHASGQYAGIYVDNGARAVDNDVYGNWSGITTSMPIPAAASTSTPITPRSSATWSIPILQGYTYLCMTATPSRSPTTSSIPTPTTGCS
jgi:hypothetical protein